MTRKTLIILGLAVTHAVLSVVVIMLDMGAAMSGFEPGTASIISSSSLMASSGPSCW